MTIEANQALVVKVEFRFDIDKIRKDFDEGQQDPDTFYPGSFDDWVREIALGTVNEAKGAALDAKLESSWEIIANV